MNKNLLHLILVFSSILLFSNCAKRGRPSGGPKDTIPPVIVRSSPENFTTNFTSKEIRIYFDEYIKLKDIQKNLIISPPLDYQPIITPLNTSKVLKIKITDTLKENTTYSFNFGESIVDNNEDNPYKFYKYIFSTGSYIDSLTVKGRVKDAILPNTDKATTVMLYERNETFKDSIIYLEKPTYITTTRDSTQNFELSNLKEGNYLLVAVQEENSNYTFEPEKDKIAFYDGVVTTPNDSSYTLTVFQEVLDYNLTRPSHISKNKIAFGYEGNADSLIFKPITSLPEDFTSTTTREVGKDSIYYWFKPEIDLEKQDTLMFLAKNKTQIDTAIVKMRDLYADSLTINRIGKASIIPRDTFQLKGSTPLVSFDAEKITIINKDSLFIPATTYIDKKYNIASIIFEKKDDQSYKIEVLPEALKDYFENTNDTLTYALKTLEESDYGTLEMNLQNVNSFPIIVELVSTKNEVLKRDYLTENRKIYFDYITPDKYYFRITEDSNQNGIWDTGNYLQKIQPETVIYFPKQIEIRANWTPVETFILD